MNNEKEDIDEIILNRVYSGYDLSKSIGYEAINFIKPDKYNSSENYIYIMPHGVYSLDHFDKKKVVLIVREINDNVLEVLAKASDLNPVLEKQVKEIVDYNDTYKIGNNVSQKSRKKIINLNKELNKKQKEFIKDHEICYAGKLLNEIFESAVPENDLKKDRIHAFITFIAGSYQKVAKHIYIVNQHSGYKDAPEHGVYLINRDSLASQSLVNYFPNDSNVQSIKQNYDKLLLLLNTTSNWDGTPYTDTKFTTENQNSNKYNSYLEFMRQTNSETIYSNMLVTLLRDLPFLREPFLNMLLRRANPEIKDESFNNIIIEQEICFKLDNTESQDNAKSKNKPDGRIDILLTDNNDEGVTKVFLIENKIKSDINGIKKDNGVIKSTQLDMYYNYINKTYPNVDKKNIHFFLLSPKYNNLNCIKKTSNGDSYIHITYHDLYHFFNTDVRKMDGYLSIINDISKKWILNFYEEFVYDLSIHTKPIDEYDYELMLRKLNNLIKK